MSDLEEFDKKLKKAQEARNISPENFKSSDPETEKETSLGMRIGIELFAGVLVGTIIGYAADKLLHTMPLFIIVFLILGTAAGFWNIYKISKR